MAHIIEAGCISLLDMTQAGRRFTLDGGYLPDQVLLVVTEAMAECAAAGSAIQKLHVFNEFTLCLI